MSGNIDFRMWDGPTPAFLDAPDAVASDDGSIEQRFVEFHAANPWVYVALVRLARDFRRRGKDRVGIKMLVEVVRWEFLRSTTSTDRFKINNSFTSRYARLVAAQEPDLASMFCVRTLRAD